MHGLNQIQANDADEIVRHYERSLANKELRHAESISSAHPDLSARFVEVDERLARKP